MIRIEVGVARQPRLDLQRLPPLRGTRLGLLTVRILPIVSNRGYLQGVENAVRANLVAGFGGSALSGVFSAPSTHLRINSRILLASIS